VASIRNQRSERRGLGILRDVRERQTSLLTRVQGGSMGQERPDLATLFEHHIDGAGALAFLLTGDVHLAEDLAQEAFVRLTGRLGHLRQPEAFGAYLRRTVVNLCRAHFRRRGVERRHANPERERSVAPHDPGPADELNRALRGLPYRQRAALVLRFYEDLSEAQVAEVLRCSPRAVNALVSRGLQALRTEIQEVDR
jgi:RNA polymerase sigma-70 factor (sigma-E family)